MQNTPSRLIPYPKPSDSHILFEVESLLLLFTKQLFFSSRSPPTEPAIFNPRYLPTHDHPNPIPPILRNAPKQPPRHILPIPIPRLVPPLLLMVLLSLEGRISTPPLDTSLQPRDTPPDSLFQRPHDNLLFISPSFRRLNSRNPTAPD